MKFRPQYHIFGLSLGDISSTLDLISGGIICASWLSVVARKEFTRFREFISWLRFGRLPHGFVLPRVIRYFAEITIANPSNDTQAMPRHDILETNAYLMSGLVVSTIDKWFIGPVPRFVPRDLGIHAEDARPTSLVLERIRSVAGDPSRLDWQAVSHLRHLKALLIGFLRMEYARISVILTEISML